MKKILMGIVLLAILLLVCIYLFIPAKSTVSATTRIHAALPAVSRMLSDDNNWKKFWPGTTPFKFNDQIFSIKAKYFSAFRIDIISEGTTINSGLQLISEKSDSLSLAWNAEYESTSNPFRRLSQYRKAASTEKKHTSGSWTLERIHGKNREYLWLYHQEDKRN